jgi:hypothetical protein
MRAFSFAQQRNAALALPTRLSSSTYAVHGATEA